MVSGCAGMGSGAFISFKDLELKGKSPSAKAKELAGKNYLTP